MTNDGRDHQIEYILREQSEQALDIRDVQKRLHDVEKEQVETRVTLTSILEVIKELKANHKWVRQTLSGSLITGVIGLIFSAIMWFIKN